MGTEIVLPAHLYSEAWAFAELMVDRINYQPEQNNKRFQIECYGKIWAIKLPVKLQVE